MIKRFRQFRLDKLSLDALNREFDLVREFADSVVTEIGKQGTKGDKGDPGSINWELEFSMGYHGVGSNIIDYVSPASDGYFWFTPDTKATTTAVDDIFFICEWRPDRDYTKCSLVLDVNDLSLGVHTDNVDIEVVKTSVGTGIGSFAMTSGAYHVSTGYVPLSAGPGDTIGLRCRLHRNESYPPSCPGPDSTMNMTAKIILTA